MTAGINPKRTMTTTTVYKKKNKQKVINMKHLLTIWLPLKKKQKKKNDEFKQQWEQQQQQAQVRVQQSIDYKKKNKIQTTSGRLHTQNCVFFYEQI